jgi:hypothetical protein
MWRRHARSRFCGHSAEVSVPWAEATHCLEDVIYSGHVLGVWEAEVAVDTWPQLASGAALP